MKRREFLRTTGTAAGAWLAGGLRGPAHAEPDKRSILWKKAENARCFHSVSCDGRPLLDSTGPVGLFEAEWRLADSSAAAIQLGPHQPAGAPGPVRARLEHRLRRSAGGGAKDVLEATLKLRNTSTEPVQVEVTFLTAARPAPQTNEQHIYLPLSAAGLSGDQRFATLGVKQFLKDCHQVIRREPFRCHYLEPMASHPDEGQTRALLLAPVVDLSHPVSPWHVALFTPSDEPVRFMTDSVEGQRVWRISRVVTLPPHGELTQHAWLMIHAGDARTAWQAFHRFGHHEAHPAIEWIRNFRVHYYDFLSSAAGQNGHRGDGYEAAVPWFRAFHVGLATQHGYYPCMGDHVHPDRPNWLAMQSDPQGPVKMSFEIIKRRIEATRKTGAKAGIYMHLSAMDDSSREFYPGLAGGRRVGPDGKPIRFGWHGPDVKGNLWWMSMASPEWRAHLLQQARWIMEILQPDAICMDETFSGLGYDYADGRSTPLGPHAIPFFKQMHALVRSFGIEKAFFTSDCSMSGFCLWADGEVGDHAYSGLLGHPLYRQEPVRYLAALGNKPWRPCAWHFRHMWKPQMALARQVGAGVGVSNGWIEYTGLHRLPETERQRLISDIESLL